MFNLKELQQIVKLAEQRRATAILRLHKAQEQGNDAKCDQLYAKIAYNNEIIENATNSIRSLSLAKLAEIRARKKEPA